MIKIAWDDTKQDEDDFLPEDWNAMVTDQKTRTKNLTAEEYTGADCTGSDGAKDRQLTLANTETTRQILVYVEGRLEAPSNMIITHNAAASTIVFSNEIFDTDNIVVYPYA